jgi:CubicO group peptidase (beta-lactamase class C family)
VSHEPPSFLEDRIRLSSALFDRVRAKAVHRVMGEEGLVGVTIGVIQNGRIAYLPAYGWADRARRIPAKIATVINWAWSRGHE